MLSLSSVNDVVTKVASSTIGNGAGVTRVESKPTVDADGQEALDITIVLKRGSAGKISGDYALDVLVGIDRALRNENDERFPIISYVTEEELEDPPDGDDLGQQPP